MSELRVTRELVEVQVHAMINQPGRLYDFLHALVEACYQHTDHGSPNARDWQRLAEALTMAELVAGRLNN